MTASALIYWYQENKWTTQFVSTIAEPKKKYGEVYRDGELVKAKFGQFVYPGLIVKVANSKAELKESSMHLAQITEEIDFEGGSERLLPEEVMLKMKELSKKDANQETSSLKRPASTVLEETPDTSTTIKRKKGTGKANTNSKTSTKTTSTNATKTNKKTDSIRLKNDAVLKLAEDIIATRRTVSTQSDTTCTPTQSTTTSATQSTRTAPTHTSIYPTPTFYDGYNNVGNYEDFQAYDMDSFYDQTMQPQVEVPPIHGTYQQLLYGDEMQLPLHLTDISDQTSSKVQELEKELDKVQRERDHLKLEVAQLREAAKGNVNQIATPRKVKFLKDLAAFFEDPSAISTTPKVQPRRSLLLADPEQNNEPQSPLLPQLQSRNSRDDSSSQPASSPYSVTKKVALLPDFQVYVTPKQLSYIKQQGTTPRALMIVLLDTLFGRETLAVSCAKGARKAVNKKDQSESQPLDASTLAAIKEYTLRVFRDNGGKPCLRESEMTDIVNSKCASARRSLQKKK